ncbi:hypothetical protein V7S57_25655 [Caulobacter sp. CCNWLY153]|uniref:hypothetical protein n=1 Tax=unclassified Caulobacter TaxID=2648921 RepID=UPI002FEEACAB
MKSGFERREILKVGAAALGLPGLAALPARAGAAPRATEPAPVDGYRLDFRAARLFQNGQDAGALTAMPGLVIRAAGGLALGPTGRLLLFADGHLRQHAQAGLLIEPASRNLCASFNAAPTTSLGWSAGATVSLKVMDARDELYAAQDPATGDYLFRDLLDQGVMNGMVLEAYNSGSASAAVTAAGVASVGVKHTLSAWTRCVAGSGDLRLTGGAAGPAYSQAYWARVERAGLTPTSASQGLTMAIHAKARIRWILHQLEPGAVATSPIVVAGASVGRAADELAIDNASLFGQPFTIVADTHIRRAGDIARRWITVSGGDEEIAVTRSADNALTLTGAGAVHDTTVAPRIPRIHGPGGARVALQVRPQGRVLSVGGANAHDAFNTFPAKLSRLTLGARPDGSEPLAGWFRSLDIRGLVDPRELKLASAPPADAMAHDIVRYLDPKGSDTADGLTPATAWATLGKAAAPATALPSGVHLLLRRGGTWPEILSPPSDWCTVSAYGEGARPIVGVGQDYGCDENNKSGFRIEGLHLRDWKLKGFNNYGFNSHMLWDCEIGPIAAGQAETNRGGVTSRNFRNFYIGACHVHDVIGDDVFLQTTKGGWVISEGNRYDPANGAEADNFQLSDNQGARVRLSGDQYDMRGASSGKGCVVVTGNAGTVIEDFVAYGLNFCIGLNGDNMVVRRGRMSSARLNAYSWGVGVGESTSVRQHLYEDLVISDCNRGVSISGIGGGVDTGPDRADITVRRVTVQNCQTGLWIDRPTSGDLSGVSFVDCAVNVDNRTTAMPADSQAESLTLPQSY